MIQIEAARRVSAILDVPDAARACYVLAHGAGAGMRHPFMSAMATMLAARGIATLRYQFPYMEQGSRRPDSPAIAHAAVRAAVRAAREQVAGIALVAGGKSFGGRMTSQAQAAEPLPHVEGLVFLGFPLHPPRQPSADRADHLFEVGVPMLFAQGTRDELAEPELVTSLVERLGSRATLKFFADADHSFHVPARSSRSDAEVMAELADTVAGWIDRLIAATALRP